MSLNTLNIKQKQGGRVVKQADRSSTFKFALQDSNGALINLNGQEASISLFNPNIKKYWSTKAKVKDAEVEFQLPGNIEENDYILEITVGGYVFPSDNDFIIEVVKGFRDLPEMETGLRYKQTIEEITQDYIERSDDKLKENLDGITDQRVKIDKANAEILKNINDTGSEYINDIKNTGDTYVSDLVANYNSAKTEFGKNASQKNEELKNNYDTYVKNLENKKDDVITLIGNKKEEVFTEIDGQVKISTDKYLNDYTKKLNDKVDKVAGKELSDNNFTNQDKAKVDNIKDPWEIIHFGNFYKDKFGTETMDDTVDNWLKIPSGYYYVRPHNIKNQPNGYAFMRVINVGSINVIWETLPFSMNFGPVYRKSGDKSGISEWKIISQYNASQNQVYEVVKNDMDGYIRCTRDILGFVHIWGKVTLKGTYPTGRWNIWGKIPKSWAPKIMTPIYATNGSIVVNGLAITANGAIIWIGQLNNSYSASVGDSFEMDYVFRAGDSDW